MEVKIIKESENPLVERDEIKFEVEHGNSSTPSRAETLKELSSKLEVSEDLIVIDKMATLQGRQVASGMARIYESKDRLKEFEPRYLVERTEVSKEKSKEAEGESEEGEEDEEEIEEEEVEEEESKGESKSEGAEERKEEE